MTKTQTCSLKSRRRTFSPTMANLRNCHNLKIQLTSIPKITTNTKSYPWLKKWTKRKKNASKIQRLNLISLNLNRVSTITRKSQNLLQNSRFSKMKNKNSLMKIKMISNLFMTTWMSSSKMQSNSSTKSQMKSKRISQLKTKIRNKHLLLGSRRVNLTKLSKRIK